MTQNYAYPFASLDTTNFTSLKEIQCIQQVIVSSGSEVAINTFSFLTYANITKNCAKIPTHKDILTMEGGKI